MFFVEENEKVDVWLKEAEEEKIHENKLNQLLHSKVKAKRQKSKEGTSTSSKIRIANALKILKS